MLTAICRSCGKVIAKDICARIAPGGDSLAIVALPSDGDKLYHPRFFRMPGGKMEVVCENPECYQLIKIYAKEILEKNKVKEILEESQLPYAKATGLDPNLVED